MKVVLPILALLVALGVVYVLAFMGVLPAQKWADKSPKLAPVLRALHLAKARKKAAPAPLTATAKPAPMQKALADGQKQLAADRAQLVKDQAAFAAQKQQAAAAPLAASASPVPETASKLNAIYATMSADDLARLFAKLPDPVIIQSLTALDEKKAGQVLAALPLTAPPASASECWRLLRPRERQLLPPLSPSPSGYNCRTGDRCDGSNNPARNAACR